MNLKSNKLIYKPSVFAIIVDILMIITNILLILISNEKSAGKLIHQYSDLTALYILLWFTISYFYKRYSGIQSSRYISDVYKLLWTAIAVFILMGIFFISPLNTSYSISMVVAYSLMNILLGTIYYIVEFALRNAIEYKEVFPTNRKEESKTLPEAGKLDKSSSDALINSIIEYTDVKVLKYISKFINLSLKNNLVSFSANFFDIKSKPEKRFSSISIFNSLNYLRGINKLLSVVNQKLPMNGLIMVCFEQSTTRKKLIFDNYPPGINAIIYFFDYLFHRVFPKLYLTWKLYYNITQGQNRALSKTEVLGRLVYCGFQIVDTKKINGITYVIAQKVKKLDEILESKRYGPLLKLRRMGKNGKVFEVYKFRTMHPYAEYIQAYIYEHSSLQKGGKFNRDIRVNTLGKFMRKFWIDETPMFLNLIRGEMKIVGVRPLSLHYFSLYTPELQHKRKRFKPGLLPPFYADMPETLEEIQASEMRYLKACEKNGTFITDIRYFFKILKNILINKARSA